MASAAAAPLTLRIATYNASLNRPAFGQLAADLATPANAQAKQVAEILQRVRPDLVLINEFDYDAANPTLAATLFHDNYLAIPQNGQAALTFPHRWTGPSNTGVNPNDDADLPPAQRHGYDFDNANGAVTAPGTTDTTRDRYGNDCYGFGWFPGQYGLAAFSRFAIQAENVRTWRKLLWQSMPGALLPNLPGHPGLADWYAADEKAIFRLSSKTHAIVPIVLPGGHMLHFLVSHPTPPSFDGTEDRNGKRNHDEIRLWADILNGASYLSDDTDTPGGLPPHERFVILGDMNADPTKGDSVNHAILQLIDHERIDGSFTPQSPGGGVNTASFVNGPLRVDHILPSKDGLRIVGGGVFWPLTGDPAYPLIAASDHRLVWLDVIVEPVLATAVTDFKATVEADITKLSWLGESNPTLTYALQTSTDLLSWVVTSENIVIDTESQRFSVTVSTDPSGGPRFYRVQVTLDAPAG